MKIIIDECVPSLVKRALPARKIVSVQDMGWAGVKNGKLLRLVADEFDVFIISDKNLKHRQNLSSFSLTINLLPSNQVPIVKARLPRIDETLSEVNLKGLIVI